MDKSFVLLVSVLKRIMNFETNEILFYDDDKLNVYLNYQGRPCIVRERVDNLNKLDDHDFKIRFR